MMIGENMEVLSDFDVLCEMVEVLGFLLIFIYYGVFFVVVIWVIVDVGQKDEYECCNVLVWIYESVWLSMQGLGLLVLL